DLRNLLLSFQKICVEVVQRHEGRIGLFIGDGVTAYFDYPRAHEDSAQRAVQAGLDILAGLTDLGTAGLEARCGVHSGAVVVGELGVGEKRPQLTDADLTAAGLPVGARKRLLKAIEGLRNRSDAAMQSMGSSPVVPTTEPAAEAERRARCKSRATRRPN